MKYTIVCRDHLGYGLSQWEMSLHCNDVSHWLSPHPKWSIVWYYFTSLICMRDLCPTRLILAANKFDLTLFLHVMKFETFLYVMKWRVMILKCTKLSPHLLNYRQSEKKIKPLADPVLPREVYTEIILAYIHDLGSVIWNNHFHMTRLVMDWHKVVFWDWFPLPLTSESSLPSINLTLDHPEQIVCTIL